MVDTCSNSSEKNGKEGEKKEEGGEEEEGPRLCKRNRKRKEDEEREHGKEGEGCRLFERPESQRNRFSMETETSYLRHRLKALSLESNFTN